MYTYLRHEHASLSLVSMQLAMVIACLRLTALCVLPPAHRHELPRRRVRDMRLVRAQAWGLTAICGFDVQDLFGFGLVLVHLLSLSAPADGPPAASPSPSDDAEFLGWTVAELGGHAAHFTERVRSAVHVFLRVFSGTQPQ